MPVDAGDTKFRYGQSITLDAGSNDVGGGDVVTFDSNGNIAVASGNGADPADFIVGTVEPSTTGYDNKWNVQIAGLPVAVEVDGDVDNGTFLEPSDNGDGSYQDAGDVGPDSSLPFVLRQESDNVYIACFR